MECNFVVGQKVVCVNGFDHPGWVPFLKKGFQLPMKNQIYTIRGIEMFHYGDGTGIGLYLSEIVNPKFYIEQYLGQEDKEIPFFYQHFKPLETKKTDISIFTKLLVPSKQHENV